MTVELKGLEEVLKNLEEKLGPKKVDRVVKKTLNDAGEDFRKGLAKAVSSYKDTGATEDEVVVSNARKQGGKHIVKAGWAGPKKRYKLVHLSEFGYVRWGKRYSPRGSGVIRQYIDVGGKQYELKVRRGLEELLR